MGFNYVELDNYVDVIGGYAFKSKMFTDEGIPVLKIKNVQQGTVDLNETQYISVDLYDENLEKYIVKDKDILIAMTGQGSVGRVGRVYLQNNNKLLLNQRVGNIKVKDNQILDSNYLFYILSSKKYEEILFNAASGSGQPNLSPTIIKSIKIPYLEINKQKFIGRILETLDSKIRLNKSIIINLERIASELFNRWFIDFEFPNEQGLSYRSSGGAMVESELGEIPKGWNIRSLDFIADYKNGLAMRKYRPTDGETALPVLKIKELNQGYTNSNSEKCSINIPDSVKISDGDIIFSWSGTLMVKIWAGGNAGLNQHLFKVTSEEFSKWFYYLWTKHHLREFIAIAESKATTMGHIKRTHLAEAKVLIPDKKVFSEAENIFTPIINEIINLSIENKNLIELRDNLLTKLLSGEIEIPDESVVERL